MFFQLLNSVDFIFWVLFIVGFFIIFLSYKNFFDKKWLKLLFIYRVSILFFTCLLLLNPSINYRKSSKIFLKWVLFIDNSASIKYHKVPSFNNIKLGITGLINSFNAKRISHVAYQFDEDFNIYSTNTYNGDGLATNFGNIPSYLEKNKNTLAGAIILTDGIITEGRNPLSAFKNNELPIHSIGIGEKKSFVDILVSSIDVPTVALKGEPIDVHASIQSFGIEKEKLSVSLYSENNLIASKYIQLSGYGSSKKVNFRFESKEIGKKNYRIQVSSIEDEININNNKQNFNLLILKDRYKVALITGSPNKNTSIIKRSLNESLRIELDHFINLKKSRFSPPLKSFWGSSYDLIILENYPIDPLSSNFIRILGKKILAHQSALMLISGPNQSNKSLTGLSSILGVNQIKDFKIEKNAYWEFINSTTEDDQIPPISQYLFLSGKGDYADSLAIFESGWPLILRNQRKNIRTVVFTSPEINKLFYHKNKTNLFSKIFDSSIDWLLKSNTASENFFRLNRDSYQQGEMVKITGTNSTDLSRDQQSVSIDILKDNSVVISQDIPFNIESNRWESEFRASFPGEYEFKIFMQNNEVPMQTGRFDVLESQIELNQIYLNEKFLYQISSQTNGVYLNWKDRNQIFEHTTKKIKLESKANVIKLINNKLLLISLVFLFCIEWLYRRIKGLI